LDDFLGLIFWMMMVMMIGNHLTKTPYNNCKEGKEEKLFPDTLFLCTTYVVVGE
jgi:hypothetical protein